MRKVLCICILIITLGLLIMLGLSGRVLIISMICLISVVFGAFSSLDIVYMLFPAFRRKIDHQVECKGKGTWRNKDGSTSSVWVSDAARYAVNCSQKYRK